MRRSPDSKLRSEVCDCILRMNKSSPGAVVNSTCALDRNPYPQVTRRRCVLRSEEHTSELQSHSDLVCRLLLEKKKNEKLKIDRIYSQQRTLSSRAYQHNQHA